MSLHFLIDGYNVIKQVEYLNNLHTLKDARMSLVKFIRQRHLAGSKNNQVTVVFDGREDIAFYDHQKKDQIKIIFSCNESADEVIKRMVGECGNPRQIVVVTDDRQIVYSSRVHGAKVIPVKEFIGREAKQPGSQSQARQRGQRNQELAKPELSLQEQAAINQELGKIWR